MKPARLGSALAALVLFAACAEPPTALLPVGGPLVPNQSRAISGPQGSETVFTIAVPPGTGTLRILLSGGSGDPDLIVRYGARPEFDLVDCVSESEFNIEECIFDLPQAGTWYILVYGFASYTNIQVLAELLPQSGATELTSGVPVTGLSGDSLAFRMFSIVVPEGALALNVEMDGEGDADVYLRREMFPLLNQYDCSSFTETSTESCEVEEPEEGIWYIRVVGYSAFSAVSLTATIEMPPP